MTKPFMALALLAFASCKSRAVPTPAGTTLLDWKNTTTALSTGVSFGAPVGAPIHETRVVEFIPNAEVRDKALGVVRIELTIDRQDIALVPNATGARPAELAALPTHATAKLLDAGGWKVLDVTCSALDGPADIGERDRRVEFSVTCPVELRGGREDIASLVIAIKGTGEPTTSAAFGAGTVH